ncbi:MAG TPA: inositol monophosphatase [Rhizomicrobium sp.]|jgi:myo-inositol-1(or 4)-monophosphatase
MGDAVRRSGDLLRAGFGAAQVLSQIDRDVKLAQDKRSEAAIVEFLQARSPHAILTEEAGWVSALSSPDALYWALDPLDGSHNYACGVPLCCVSLALCRGARPIAGCIYDFAREETIWGGADYGLWLNDVRLDAAPPNPGNTLATGFPVGGAENAAALLELRGEVAGYKKIRMIGSAALSLAWVARGLFDAYAENGIRWWDVAGGLALVEGAGGGIGVEGNVLSEPLKVRADRHGVPGSGGKE